MEKEIQYIWTDLHQELRSFIHKKVNDPDLSQDLLQDVFLKIHQNIHTLSDSAKLTAWVYQLTRNTVADYFRKNKPSSPFASLDLAEQESEEPLYASLSNCLNQKIEALPEKYKQAILLTTFQNYSQIALADELHVSYSGAKTRVQRGKEKLKESILNCPNVEVDQQQNILAYHTPEKKL